MKWRRVIPGFEAIRSWQGRGVWRLLAVSITVLSISSAFAQTPGAVLTRIHTLSSDEGRFTGLIRGSDGNLYGTTRDDTHATGTVFEAAPDGTLTTVRQFTSAHGAYPTQLIQGVDGNFYGVTSNAGGLYAIFRLTPDGSSTTLHTFNNGSRPYSLLLAKDGNLYGAAAPAGTTVLTGGSGTLFRLAPSGAFTSFSPFAGTSLLPLTLLQGVDGDLYGAAAQIFAPYTINPDLRTLGQLFRFTAADGTVTQVARLNKRTGAPNGNLLQDGEGSFYHLGSVAPVDDGTALVPGITLVKTTPSGRRTVFPLGSGYPRGLTPGPDGNFYVVITPTPLESVPSTGSVLVVAPNGTETTIFDFSGSAPSADSSTVGFPFSRLVQAENGSLYGLASDADSTFLYRLEVTVPTVTLTAPVPRVVAGSGSPGKFLFTLSAPWPHGLTVAYTVTGNATPGTDYQALSGSVTIPAGQTSAVVQINPGQSLGSADKKTVKLTLAPGAGYAVGASAVAKVKLAAP